jgi:hypothetical protein
MMKRNANFCKVVSASVALLASASPVVYAMETPALVPSDKPETLRDHDYYKQELQKLEESTRRIHTEVDRILAEFRRNMEEYRKHTRGTVTIAPPQAIHGMEDVSNTAEQNKPLEIQLSKGAHDDALEAVLGTGNNLLLKIGMSLKCFRGHLDAEYMELPVQLFLTDFTSSPTNHPSIELNFKADCEPTTPTCVLPDKPQAFDSYAQFTDWLNKGYFANQVRITYDFQVDVQKSAPSLAQHLFPLPPNGYRLVGTHVVDNTKILPDDCSPKVAYVSQRGNINTTTVTLGGIFYLNKKLYPIDDHQQVFPHTMLEQQAFKKDEIRKLYHHQWIAQPQITSATYEEFPTRLAKNWPQAPSETYSLLQQQPETLKEEIKHLSCFDGSTGENIDITTSNRTFFIISEEARKKQPIPHEAIVKDELGKYYITRYRYIKLREEAAEAEQQIIQAKELAWQKVIEVQRAAATRLQNEADKQSREWNNYVEKSLQPLDLPAKCLENLSELALEERYKAAEKLISGSVR